MLLFWCLAAVVVVAYSQPDCADPEYALSREGVGECPYYYDLLENALLNGPGNLYRLKRVFFPATTIVGPTKVHFCLEVNVSIVGNRTCFKDDSNHKVSFCPSEGWYHSMCLFYAYPEDGCQVGCISSCIFQHDFTWRAYTGWSTLKSIASGVANALPYEGILNLFPPMTLSLYPYEPWYQGGTDHVALYLTLDQLECNPEESSTMEVLGFLISWIKTYAVAQGTPETWSHDDQGIVVDVTENEVPPSEVQNPVLALYIFVNLSVVLVLMRFLPGVYNVVVSKISKETKLKRELFCTVYWGTATVLFHTDLVLIIFDLVDLAFASDTVCYSELRVAKLCVATLLIITTKFLLFILAVALSVAICKNSTKGIDFPFSGFGNIFCCCCCCCRCCIQSVRYKALQTLAVWSVISFVQHLTMSAVPLVFMFIVIPGETLSIMMLYLSAVFCIIMLVSHVFYMWQVRRSEENHPSRKTSLRSFLVQIAIIISLLSGVIVLGNLYLELLSKGAKFNSFGGLSVSLIPSVTLSLVAWFVKNRLLQSYSNNTPKTDGRSEDLNPGVPTCDERTPLIQN